MMTVTAASLTKDLPVENVASDSPTTDLNRHSVCHTGEEYCFGFSPNSGVPDAGQTDALQHRGSRVSRPCDKTASVLIGREGVRDNVAHLHLPAVANRGIAVRIAIFHQVRVSAEGAVWQSGASDREGPF